MNTIIIKYLEVINLRMYLFYLFGLMLIVSCEDFVEIEAPKTELVGSVVFTDEQTAEAALIGIYSQMTEGFGGFANYKTTLLTGLYADELDNFNTSATQVEFYENALNSNNVDIANLWNEPYNYIYQANAIIEGLSTAEGISDNWKDQLIGEALFIRAFCHFFLVNFFGDVPYITSSDYLENSKASRLPIAEVYNLLIDDLEDAASLLTESYVSDGRVRPNRYVVEALLARAYLYNGDWINAENAANTLIEASQYQLEADLNQVFLAGSREAIWQLYPVITGLNTVEGFSFILNGAPYNVALRNLVVEAFEENDQRLSSWIGSVTSGSDIFYYPNKYKIYFSNNLSEYYMVLRVAEQYLIRAETRIHLNNLEGALEDLNMIRNRADLDNFTSTSNELVLEAVYKERQRELFAEWGHRWFDLKRTGKADEVMSLVKSGWQSTDKLFPIPQIELQINPNITQNPGY